MINVALVGARRESVIVKMTMVSSLTIGAQGVVRMRR